MKYPIATNTSLLYKPIGTDNKQYKHYNTLKGACEKFYVVQLLYIYEIEIN